MKLRIFTLNRRQRPSLFSGRCTNLQQASSYRQRWQALQKLARQTQQYHK